MVDRRQPGLSKDERAEEIIALIPERGDQAKSFGGTVRSVYQSIIDGIKAFYKLVFNRNLSDADVRDIVAMAERWAQGDEHVTAIVNGQAESFALSQSKAPMFGKSPAGETKPSKLSGAWERYDDTGESTINDLVDDVDALINSEDIPGGEQLQEAVDVWREKKHTTRRWPGVATWMRRTARSRVRYGM